MGQYSDDNESKSALLTDSRPEPYIGSGGRVYCVLYSVHSVCVLYGSTHAAQKRRSKMCVNDIVNFKLFINAILMLHICVYVLSAVSFPV